MQKYIKKLLEIDREVYDNMDKASQKVIDFVQDTLEQLGVVNVDRFEISAIGYEISILLEVWNPSLEYDISVLKRLEEVVNSWYKEITPN